MTWGRTPMARDRPRASSWARTLGRKPSAFTAARTAVHLPGATGVVPLSTRDTVLGETPAVWAMSRIVTTAGWFPRDRRLRGFWPVMGSPGPVRRLDPELLLDVDR